MTATRILVLGGTGFFGRYLVQDLLAHTAGTITVSSRRTSPWITRSERVHFTPCNIRDVESVRQLVARHDLVIHCAGPFQYLPLNPLHAAIEMYRDYIDLSEGREFYHRVVELTPRIEAAGIDVYTGMSIVPALQAILVEMVRPLFDRLTSIRTFLAPATYRNRGPAMFHTMLLGAGSAFPITRNGRQVPVRGWSEGEWVQFPPPIGRRLTYHVLDWADSDVLPALFGVGTVECKAGSEFAWANRMLSLAGLVRAWWGRPRWERWTVPIRTAAWLLGRAGRDDGGVLLEVSGESGGRRLTHRITVVAPVHGGRIPVLPAAMVVEDILAGKRLQRGIVPANEWIAPGELVARLGARGVQVLWQPGATGGWRSDLPLP